MTQRRSLIRGTILCFCVCLVSLFGIHAVTAGADEPAGDNRIGGEWRDNPYNVTVTRDPASTPLIDYTSWLAAKGPAQPFSIIENQFVAADKGARATGGIDVIVNTDLYVDIYTAVTQYLDDLAADGYTATLYTTNGGTAEDMRGFLQTRYAEGLVGAVLVGDLPVAWYEAECWDDPVTHEEFPCDLYYMDLDGAWEDFDVDGLFDDHSGSLAPEIYIGRLTASPLTYGGRTEAELVNNYFDKNHRYRTGQLIFPDRAMTYIDDDWSMNNWQNDVAMAYPDVTAFTDDILTVASDYRLRLQENYEAILLCAHSSPNTHWFKSPAIGWTTIDYDEIVDTDPVAAFYNLFNCSGARFTETNYFGGWYIFADSYGLSSIGSTKTGSMLLFDFFYSPFAQGKSVGESFAEWFAAMAGGGMQDWEVCWFYGMTLCGDPTLIRHRVPTLSILSENLPDVAYGDEYLFTLEAIGGIPPYNWQLLSGELPKDLTLETATGTISGLADEAGTFTFSIEISDTPSPGQADTASLQLVVTYTCGDANGDGALNVADAVYIINHVFKGGPISDPEQAGDANCDGGNDVGDAVYMINYTFKNGPAPCCL